MVIMLQFIDVVVIAAIRLQAILISAVIRHIFHWLIPLWLVANYLHVSKKIATGNYYPVAIFTF